MANSLADIQEIINKRAETRLNNDLNQITQFVRSNKILSPTNNELLRINVEGEKKFPYWFFASDSGYMKKIKESLLPEYIAEESKAFIDKVNGLEKQVSDLMNYRQEEE